MATATHTPVSRWCSFGACRSGLRPPPRRTEGGGGPIRRQGSSACEPVRRPVSAFRPRVIHVRGEPKRRRGGAGEVAGPRHGGRACRRVRRRGAPSASGPSSLVARPMELRGIVRSVRASDAHRESFRHASDDRVRWQRRLSARGSVRSRVASASSCIDPTRIAHERSLEVAGAHMERSLRERTTRMIGSAVCPTRSRAFGLASDRARRRSAEPSGGHQRSRTRTQDTASERE